MNPDAPEQVRTDALNLDRRIDTEEVQVYQRDGTWVIELRGDTEGSQAQRVMKEYKFRALVRSCYEVIEDSDQYNSEWRYVPSSSRYYVRFFYQP